MPCMHFTHTNVCSLREACANALCSTVLSFAGLSFRHRSSRGLPDLPQRLSTGGGKEAAVLSSLLRAVHLFMASLPPQLPHLSLRVP